MGISVLRQNTAICRLANLVRALRCQIDNMRRYFIAIARDENFLVGLEKFFNADPGIGNETGRRARGLEHSRRR